MNVSISRNGVEIGDWTEEQICALYKEGQLLPTDHYWKEGMIEWAELSKMIKPPPPSAIDENEEQDEEAQEQPRTTTIYDEAKVKTENAFDGKVDTALILVGGAIIAVYNIVADPLSYLYAVFMGALGGLPLGLFPFFIARLSKKVRRPIVYLLIVVLAGSAAGLFGSIPVSIALSFYLLTKLKT